jgi:riboflavin kinase/FMN adenylyltransferase
LQIIIDVIYTHSIDELPLKNAWLTIGIFDGVHRGHQQILRSLVIGAHQAGAPAVVLTFSPHPAVVLGGKKDFRYLTSPEERLVLLELLGVDVVITQAFDRAFADQTAEDFMRQVVQALGLGRLIIGYDTALGRGREGDAAHLIGIGKELGYTVQVIPPLSDEDGVISSTRIRASIATGDVSAAAKALGRFYDMFGLIVHGDGRGHRINVPTANLSVSPDKVIPAYGIYACWAWLETASLEEGKPGEGSKKYLAAVNVGVRPTFTPDLSAPAIEAHLLDFKGDIYGQQLKLEFVEYLRPEEKFTSVESLVEQIRLDISQTRGILS